MRIESKYKLVIRENAPLMVLCNSRQFVWVQVWNYLHSELIYLQIGFVQNCSEITHSEYLAIRSNWTLHVYMRPILFGF